MPEQHAYVIFIKISIEKNQMSQSYPWVYERI